MTEPPANAWVFVIDTEQYAGNFERELCAFLTGQVGDCGKGDDYVDHLKDRPSFENVWHVPDDHGAHRPASIWATPGWSNDGKGNHSKKPGKWPAHLSVAIFFESRPTPEQIKFLKANAAKFNDFRGEFIVEITITDFRLLHITKKEIEHNI